MAETHPYNASLTERRSINDCLAVFRVRLDSGQPMAFEPGQFTTLALVDPDAAPRPTDARRRGPKMIRRAYTLANSPDQQTQAFYIARVGTGRLTPLLWQLNVGDPLFMDTHVKGEFTLADIPDDKNLIMIGTGTGIAPFRSMINHYRGKNRWQKLVLIESARTADRLGYHDELKQCAAGDDSILYLPTLTREPADSPWSGLRSRISELLKPNIFHQHTGLPLDPDRCHALLCGNPAMIDQAIGSLAGQGFLIRDRDHPQGNIRFERYW